MKSDKTNSTITAYPICLRPVREMDGIIRDISQWKQKSRSEFFVSREKSQIWSKVSFTPVPNIKKNPLYGHALWLKAWAHRRFFFSVWDRGKFNELLIIYCIFFVFIFYLWELPPTLAPAVYSHGSVAKQWPRNCEAPGSKPCRCAILVPFCGALILITVICHLWLKGVGPLVDKHISIHML